jgi:lysine 2,3-aminomutase
MRPTTTTRRRAARRPRDLAAAGLVDPSRLDEISRASGEFALAITPEMLDAMAPGDEADPIYRQFVPTAAELETRPEERADPIGDERFAPVKGIVHRYPDRLLLTPVHVCPVYCRFCFRREKLGPRGDAGAALGAAELGRALDYVRARTEVREVILSGGDPLVLPPRRLGRIVAALDAIAHVEVIRVHTRVPVVDPGRVSGAMVGALKAATPVWVVVHANHAREFGPAARAACARLADAGIPLLGQTVLLRGVNDDPDVMAELLRVMVRNRVKPYYLHHGDLARGTGHFRTGIDDGRRLMRALRGRISGLCQPAYVLDVPGGYGKVPIGPSYIEGDGAGGYRVEDVHGEVHAYPPVASHASARRRGRPP